MIASIVLAAGKSERMGRPKMSLPWGNNTVIGQVVTTLISVGLEQVVVVTGGGREDVLLALNSLPKEWPVSTVENPEYVAGEMLSSLQVGVASLGEQGEAALIALGAFRYPEMSWAPIHHLRLNRLAVWRSQAEYLRAHGGCRTCLPLPYRH